VDRLKQIPDVASLFYSTALYVNLAFSLVKILDQDFLIHQQTPAKEKITPCKTLSIIFNSQYTSARERGPPMSFWVLNTIVHGP